MPTYLPEGNAPRSQDDELRTTHKWASELFAIFGNSKRSPFPEGCEPRAQDGIERLEQKINCMLA